MVRAACASSNRGQELRVHAGAMGAEAHVFKQVARIGGSVAVGAVMVLVARAPEHRAEDDDGIGRSACVPRRSRRERPEDVEPMVLRVVVVHAWREARRLSAQ